MHYSIRKDTDLTRRGFMALGTAGALSLAAASLWGCSSPFGPAQPKDTLKDEIDAILEEMSVEDKVAQLFMVEPEALLGEQRERLQAENSTTSKDDKFITAADEEFLEALKQYPVAGLVFFKENLHDASQTKSLLDDLSAFASENNIQQPFFAVDEEGGTVSRIGKNPGFELENVGDMAAIGASGDVEKARAAAEKIGSYLKEVGFNLDFAPVCDIANTPASVMKKRSFGSEAELVGRMVEAQVEGFHEADMLCCAKHFPGIGAATLDSHTESISSTRTFEQMESEELIPFQKAIDAGVDFVMMGHLAAPELTGDNEPASLSPMIVRDLLREGLGFEGVIVTDSLQMRSVSDHHAPSEAALMAIEAGCDIVLMPESFIEAYEGVLQAVQDERLSMERIDESLTRILRCKLTKLA